MTDAASTTIINYKHTEVPWYSTLLHVFNINSSWSLSRIHEYDLLILNTTYCTTIIYDLQTAIRTMDCCMIRLLIIYRQLYTSRTVVLGYGLIRAQGSILHISTVYYCKVFLSFNLINTSFVLYFLLSVLVFVDTWLFIEKTLVADRRLKLLFATHHHLLLND